tara:strand:+ start:1542 stop:2720 length:1179 start_codon:yes stop_codon:yes gene_type:complete
MKKDEFFYSSLIEYCNTDTQKSVIQTLSDNGGKIREAARSLNKHHSAIVKTVQRVESNAALRGWSPHHNVSSPCPPGYHLKGTSTLLDGDGEIKQQWVKTDKDKVAEFEIAKEIYEDLAKDVKRLPSVKSPRKCDSDLLNFYVLTDCHIGMLAWGEEGGRDWNLQIAEDVIIDAFRSMVAQSPSAEKCIIAQLGDLLHWDSMIPVTPASGHILDSSGRYAQVVSIAVKIIRTVMDDALKKHKIVHAVMATGNHDSSGSIWLRQLLAALYENESRVTVDLSPKPFYSHRHGSTMLAMHHGHLVKPPSLPGMFAATESEMWGKTKYRYAHIGHRHTAKLMESEIGGMHVIEHPTLAARDAYASHHGYFSNSGARATTYHKDHGECGSVVVRPKA